MHLVRGRVEVEPVETTESFPVEVDVDDHIWAYDKALYFIAALLYFRHKHPIWPLPEWDTMVLVAEDAKRFGRQLHRVTGIGGLNEVIIRTNATEFIVLGENGDGDPMAVIALEKSGDVLGIA